MIQRLIEGLQFEHEGGGGNAPLFSTFGSNALLGSEGGSTTARNDDNDWPMHSTCGSAGPAHVPVPEMVP